MGLLAQRIETHDSRCLFRIRCRAEAPDYIAQENRFYFQKLSFSDSIRESSYDRIVEESFEYNQVLQDMPARFRMSSHHILLKLDVILRWRNFTVGHVSNSSRFLNDMETLVHSRVLLLVSVRPRRSPASTTGCTSINHVLLGLGLCREQ